MTSIGFVQSKADPSVFRKVVIVHVGDILARAKDKDTMDSFAPELGRRFKLKDMGDAKYYIGCNII